ncbi:MAG TPA: hypothetical protein VKU80_04285 [Planctomycetota bacterium]|nr:hypothetical protein [Planctomycetota bacterium]
MKLDPTGGVEAGEEPKDLAEAVEPLPGMLPRSKKERRRLLARRAALPTIPGCPQKNNRRSGRPPYGAISSAQAVYFFRLWGAGLGPVPGGRPRPNLPEAPPRAHRTGSPPDLGSFPSLLLNYRIDLPGPNL